MISYEAFHRIYNASEGEPEFTIWFLDRKEDYMIIKYSDGPTFQRCGYQDEASGEIKFCSLDELCETEALDGIKLIRDWFKIDYISKGDGFGMLCEDDIDGWA